jgi:glutamate/tyrosine decarboxylase-like PLP-dependent enzyme
MTKSGYDACVKEDSICNPALLESAARRSARYLSEIGERRAGPSADAVRALRGFDVEMPDAPVDPETVLDTLDRLGSPATVATTGGRYFGFVMGGSLPVTVAANWLAAAWDQNAVMAVTSPVAAAVEDVASRWLLEILGLPRESGVGFVGCDTVATFAGLAAARRALLLREGWDVDAQGLFGAPPITVVVSEETHVSVHKALGLLGLGRERVVRVPADGQGRMRAEALPRLSGPTLICAQAGNVNTGSFDPAAEICAAAHAAGAWVHVDGAFGIWAAAAPERAHLARGVADADSWSFDGHKWLNVPYDSGIAVVREARHLRDAMSGDAAYLQRGSRRDPGFLTPGMSVRARGVEVWAALASLGRSGVADLIERTCRHAARFAEGLRAAGFEILNDVVINQVLVSFGDDETTRAVIAAIQEDGTCWCGGTFWHGRAAMRISVSGWATTVGDVERSLEAMVRVASRQRQVATSGCAT